MIKLRYTVSMDDVLALNHFICLHSSTIRRSRIMLVFGLPVFLMVFEVYRGIRGGSWVLHVIMLVLCVLLIPFLNWYFARGMKRTAQRIYREYPTKGLIGEHELSIDEAGVTERSEIGEQVTRWAGVDRIDTTPEHAFIFVGPAMAHVVPRATVVEGEFDSFITAAKAHVQATARRTQQ